MREDLDPKGKGYLLGTHILDKGFQAGSLVGVLIVGPLTAYRLYRRGEGDILRRATKACGTSAVVGAVLAGAAGLGVVYGKGIPVEGIEDRVYRLYHNAGQQRTDRFSWTGIALGAGAAAGRYGLRDPRLLLGGAALGSAAGVLAHVTTHREDSVIPSNMVEELKSSRGG